MKTLVTILIFLITQKLSAQNPTDAGFPDPEHVLVVYAAPNNGDSTSYKIMDYYYQKRNIPESNIVEIDDIPLSFTYPGEGMVTLVQNGEDLRGDGRTGWLYVRDFLAEPIELHLNTTFVEGTPLKDIIRYIVLCKGLPLKVRSIENMDNHTFRYQASVDALLCLINQPDSKSFVDLYGTWYLTYPNPYFEVDDRFTLDYRFISDHFVKNDWYLQYLVSRLDGDNLGDVKAMIDRSFDPDMSGEKYWIIDDDPAGAATGTMEEAHRILKSFEFNLNPEIYVNSPEWIVNNAPSYEKVMGYVSHGVNTAYNDSTRPRMPETYILDTLDFEYAQGAIFNSWESFNGWSFYQVHRHGHGLLSDFIQMGGTGGGGHVYEPTGPGASVERIIFPSYAVGYSIVDAIYQGIPYIAWKNTVVGDPLSRIYDCEPIIISTNTTLGSGDYNCDIIVPLNVTLTVDAESVINFKRNASLKVYGTLEIDDGALLNFNSYSSLELDGNLTVTGNTAFMNFNQKSLFEASNFSVDNSLRVTLNDYSNLNIDEEGTLTTHSGNSFIFNDDSKLNVYGKLIVNEINEFNLNDDSKLLVHNKILTNDGAVIHCNNNSSIETHNKTYLNAGTIINFNHNSSLTARGTVISRGSSENNVILNFSGLSENQFIVNTGDTLLIDYTTFNNNGLYIEYSDDQSGFVEYVSITNSNFEDGEFGINLEIKNVTIPPPLISKCNINNCKYGMIINGLLNNSIFISQNTLTGNFDGYSECGMMLTNGNNATISDNIITNFILGLQLSAVGNPSIVDNYISAVDLTVDPGAGIFTESCNGEIRKNRILNHSYGIELGGSSPNLAENDISESSYYGLYVSSGSYPNLGQTLIGNREYPLTGYNEIRENGLCGNDNSEIYFFESGADLSIGCNTIADDRENDPGNGCDYILLIDGEAADEIIAVENFWGNHPVYGNDPSQRFGQEIYIEYDPYLEEPCTYVPEGEFLLMRDSEGRLIDTVYSSGPAPNELIDLQSRYATANNYYYDKLYAEAKHEYQQIIQNYGNNSQSIHAYNKLLTIEKILSETPEPFNQLKNLYQEKLNSITDSTMISTVTHLSNLCLVASEQYQQAIDTFDEIVQSNPNTDLALYREIDALTTALLIQDSTLLKGKFSKYSVSSTKDYARKVQELLKTRGKNSIHSDEELLPENYFLYQNYPNPFNPVTTIKYDLPNASEVSIIIYDILGRKVKTLVNEQQQPGRYEVQFDASSLASGVYLYQIRAEDFVSTKKMILLR